MTRAPLFRYFALSAFCALLAACSGSRTVSITDGWIERPTEEQAAEVHLRIRNGMDQTVRLVAAAIEGSDNARFLAAASGQALPTITLSAGQTLRVPEDGYRILIPSAAIDWQRLDSINLQLAVEQADGQLLTLSYELHVHDQEEPHHDHHH